MYRVISFLSFVLVVLVVAGYLLGWFSVQTGSVDENGQQQINITVNRQKIQEDAAKVKESVKEFSRDLTAPDDGTAETDGSELTGPDGKPLPSDQPFNTRSRY